MNEGKNNPISSSFLKGTDDSIEDWISKTGSGNIAGADPELVGAGTWLDWDKVLEEGGVDLVTVENLIDKVWTNETGRPTPSYKVGFNITIFVQTTKVART